MNIGEKIEELRRARGMSQAELARRAGIHPQTLNRIIKGKIKAPRWVIVTKLAAALDLDVLGYMDLRAAVPSTLTPQQMLAQTIRNMSFVYRNDPGVLAWINRAADDVERNDPFPDEGKPAARHSNQSADASEKFQIFEVPPSEFIKGDWDYPQTYRGGETALLGAGSAGGFEDVDVSGETAEVLNPTLRDVQSGRYGVVRVDGDSMEPRLHDGDLVLLDTFEKTPKPKRIMAVYALGKGSAFGYVHRVGDLTLLTKANPAYPPVILPEDVIIRGTVKKRLSEDLE